MFIKAAMSRADLAIGPAESANGEIRMIPAPETRPMVGLIVYRAALVAGMLSEPSVSVPTEMGANPAATPTAEPDE